MFLGICQGALHGDGAIGFIHMLRFLPPISFLKLAFKCCSHVTFFDAIIFKLGGNCYVSLVNRSLDPRPRQLEYWRIMFVCTYLLKYFYIVSNLLIFQMSISDPVIISSISASFMRILCLYLVLHRRRAQFI